MGVPSFYRWLSKKYPEIITDVVEEKAEMVGDTEIPIDSSQPNPNGQEFDNLYLDMNGIIHPCTHPEDGKAPKSIDEMMQAIFAYIDRIFAIVRPRRLLYMAIDGVAPRAKMNQQRSRRFRAAKEAKEAEERDQALIDAGKGHLVEKKDGMKFDSNVITPGTPFMDKVAKSLRFYAAQRMNSDPGWRGIEVIISDSNIPGEGEHKIMDFIRKARIQEGYDPQTRHVLYGLDADLIMLGLATHEVNFSILREVIMANKGVQTCHRCGQPGHYADQCRGKERERESDDGEKPPPALKPYQFLHIAVLREYLERDLKCSTSFPWDLERALDDWVFLCFFVGNDFLPHLPTLKIRDGAINMLMGLYKQILPSLPDFLTKNGEVNLASVELIMHEVGKLEDGILRRMRRGHLRQKENQKRRKEREVLRAQNTRELGKRPHSSAFQTPTPADMQSEVNRDKAKRLRASLHGAPAPPPKETSSSPTTAPDPPVVVREAPKEEEPELPDEVRLGEEGWKERYYNHKFKVSSNDQEFKKQLCRDYIEGLVWVMKYYYQGCASWTWFYPHHYAPFSSDLVNLSSLEFHFGPSEPFRPFEQLMGVLPALSGHALPENLRQLMVDPDSPIIDFYPDNFEIDMDGCRMAWQGVALLPFIDEKRLLEAVRPLEDQLTGEELRRNTPGTDVLFVNNHHSLAVVAKKLYAADGDEVSVPSDVVQVDVKGSKMLDLGHSFDLFGAVKACDVGAGIEPHYESPLRSFPSIKDNTAYAMFYEMPIVPPDHKWVSGLLPNATLPPKRLSEMDFLTERRPTNWVGSAGERMTIHYAGLRGQHGRGRGGYQPNYGGRGGGSGPNPYHRGPPQQRYDPRQQHQQPPQFDRRMQRPPAQHGYGPSPGRYPPPQQQRYTQGGGYPPGGPQQPRYPQQQPPQVYPPPAAGGYGPPLGAQPAPVAAPGPAVDPVLLQQAQLLVQQLQGQAPAAGAAYHRPAQPVQPISFFQQQQQHQRQPSQAPPGHPPYQP
mmetsp:Transcript_1572/g.5540  ORF Transcript_1572/g.5540 Transcript_1572/m.5540 type:complete len:1005 (-) Transcript_1572:62-3076(-)